MILKNEETDVSKYYKINDVSDIPDEGLTAENVDLIKKVLAGDTASHPGIYSAKSRHL